MNHKKSLLSIILLACGLLSFAEVNIGVFLPFKSKGPSAQQAVEYYRGLLMAVDSLSNMGTTFKVTAADCGKTAADIQSLLDESKNGVFDIIFAPSNLPQAEVINKYSILNGTKVVMPFGGRYDELITNPNFYALKVTQTDYTIAAYKLITQAFKGKKLYVVSTNGGTQICPLANYVKNYVKGAKLIEATKKEEKVMQLLPDKNAIIIPSMYDENTQKAIMTMVSKVPSVNATIIGYPNWYERTLTSTESQTLGKANVYLVMQQYPRQGLPRVNKFIHDYQANFDTTLPNEKFSIAMWGFDTGYYMLKAISRYKREFKDQSLYSAPLQNKFHFEPRNNGQGYINTHVILLHYKANGTQDIIESTEY